jgi:hypothetical protein
MLWYVLAYLRVQKHKLKINERQKRRLYHCHHNRIRFGNYRQDRESSIKLRYGALLYQFDRRKHRPWAIFYQLQARKSRCTVKAKIHTHSAEHSDNHCKPRLAKRCSLQAVYILTFTGCISSIPKELHITTAKPCISSAVGCISSRRSRVYDPQLVCGMESRRSRVWHHHEVMNGIKPKAQPRLA